MKYVKIAAVAVVGVFALLLALGSGDNLPKPDGEKAAAKIEAAANRAITPDDKRALGETVTEFGTAMKEGDFDRIVETIPAPVMAAMAEKSGVDADQIAPAMKQQMQSALSQVEIVEFGMDAENAELKQTEDGLIYAIVDTRTVMKTADETTIEAKTPTLAVMDDGKWHLLRVDNDQQKALVAQVYPGLKGVSFPESTMEQRG